MKTDDLSTLIGVLSVEERAKAARGVQAYRDFIETSVAELRASGPVTEQALQRAIMMAGMAGYRDADIAAVTGASRASSGRWALGGNVRTRWLRERYYSQIVDLITDRLRIFDGPQRPGAATETASTKTDPQPR